MPLFDDLSPKDSSWTQAVRHFGDYHIRNCFCNPILWTEYANLALTWRRVRFDGAGVRRLPNDKCGIYTFVAEPAVAGHSAVGYLLYVGETERQSLRERCSSYLNERGKAKGRIHICEMIRKWPDHLFLHYAIIDNKSLITKLEDDLIAAFLPPFNKEFPARIGRLIKAVRV
jgi:hypothetical protein